MSDAEELFDVVIVGGGLVGSSLALMLAAQQRRVVLIEAQAPRIAEPAWDERCIGLSAASRCILEALGLWDTMAADATPILATHISERGRFGTARFTAEQAGLSALGYNTPLRVINQSLWRAAQQSPHIELRCPASVRGVAMRGERVEIRLAENVGRPAAAGGHGPPYARTKALNLSAKLLIAADGANSAVRQLLGIGSQTRDYDQSAIVTAIRPRRDPAGLAYERFLPGGPLAILPKPGDTEGHACSLIWTVPRAHCDALLQLPDASFLAQAADAFGERLGVFRSLGRRQAHPLTQVVSDSLSAPRVLLVGNAAQSLHPVAAQGFNLGLRDAATAAELLHDARDPGAPELLREYAGRRAADRERVAAFTDGIVRLFSNAVPGLRSLRHLGLFALDLQSPAREAVLRQNLGFGGTVPHLARQKA